MSDIQVVLTKRPDDKLDYDVDFSKWLPTGDAIDSVSVAVDDESGVVLHSGETAFTATVVKVWLSGGTDGATGTITVEATTAQGRTKEYCFRLRIRERC